MHSDYFSVHEIDKIIVKLGYSEKDKMYYHFRKPGFYLDFGMFPVGNDVDILNLINCRGNDKVIFVYIEHGRTTSANYFRTCLNSNVVIEEIVEEPVVTSQVKRKRRGKLYLEWKEKETNVEGDVFGEAGVHGGVEGNVEGLVFGEGSGHVDGIETDVSDESNLHTDHGNGQGDD